MKLRLLDLFCGAGGCSVGYARAGFEVTGVDIAPHSDYPFEFIQADAMAMRPDRLVGCWHESEALTSLPDRLNACLGKFDVVHASPPCPRYSTITPDSSRDSHPDLIGPIREILREWGGVYVIENVPGAARVMDNPALMCGAAMGLGATCRDGQFRQLKRHRLFESTAPLMTPGCACDARSKLGVYGDGGGGLSTRPSGGGGYKGYPEEARKAMGIDWMNREDLSDAIPPAYTEYLGAQLLDALEAAA